MPGAVPVALLLVVATLQLQSACGRSPWTEADKLARVQATTANSLIQAMEQYFKNGLSTLQGSMCDHLQTLLSALSTSGRLHLSPTGPPHAGNSLLDVDDGYWTSATVKATGYHSMENGDHTHVQEDQTLYVFVDDSQTLSISEALFPGQASNLPQNNLINMTFNCATGQLDVHMRVSGEVEIVPQVLSLSNLIISVRVAVGSHSALKAMIMSANTQMFTIQAFVAVRYNFETSTFAIKGIPVDTSSVNQIPHIQKSLSSLPTALSDLLNSKITAFNYDLLTADLILHTTLPEITLIPNVLKLTSVSFTLDCVIGSSPSVKHLTFIGTWKVGTVSLNTRVVYNGTSKLLHLTSSPDHNSLNIEALMKNIAGISHTLPNQLTSVSLSSMVGNIYNNGRFFVVLSGAISGGKLYLLFHKGSGGVKVGIAASVDNFHLSDFVRTATGADITSIPYFGTLVVPSMAIAIASGTILSPTLPHLFGKGSSLLLFNDTLPAGVSSIFHLDIDNTKGAIANSAHGVTTIKLPKSSDLSVESLVSHIPGLSDAIQALPSQISSILNARVTSFSFNSTSKDLSISGSLSHFTLVSGFISISDVKISYNGVLNKKVTTKSIDLIGTWQIGDYSILISITYDGVVKEVTISSQSQGGKQLSTENMLETLAGTEVPLPSVISSFTFTSLSGKMAQGTTVVVVNGRVGTGRISAVFEKSPNSDSVGAVVANVASFKLAELIQSATGIDTSSVPFFGPMVIPELTFAVSTNNITSPLIADLVRSNPQLEDYKDGIIEGVSGRFTVDISEARGITVEFAHKKLSFTIPDTSSLSLGVLLSKMPSVKDVIQKLPSQLSNVFSATIDSFSYDPTFKELHFSGSIENEVNIVPQFVSLSNVKISLKVVLSQPILVETLDFSGDWVLRKLPIHTTVSYNREEKQLDITGELSRENGGINIKELVTSLSKQDLPIPPTLHSATLETLSGNKIGDTTLVTLSGTAGQGDIYAIYEESPIGSAIAFAADAPKFKFSSLVSSTTGIDISGFPFFGTLVIPQIGVTISSEHINNPLLSGLYTSTSPLTKLGDAISKGVTATFVTSFGNVQGVIADYENGELELSVPNAVELYMNNIIKLIPGLQEVISNLPSTLQDVTSSRVHKIIFSPYTKEIQLSGSLASLVIVPGFLNLQNVTFEISATIGANTTIELAKFKGNWKISTLELTTEVTFDNLLIMSGYPTDNRVLDIKKFIEGLTGSELNIPSSVTTLKLSQMIGEVRDGTTSVVLLGQIHKKDKISIVYQMSRKGKVVALAGDVAEFKLAELVKTGAGVDISSVPFFGTFTIPALSFVISSKQFSTALLPDLKVPGVPKELFLESIPEGVKGQFLADIGSAVGINVDYSDNILTLEVPSSVSLSLQGLLSVIPEIKNTIDALPSTVNDILNAKITKLVFRPATRDLFVYLSLESLTLVPNLVSMKNTLIYLDVNMEERQLKTAAVQKRESPISSYVSPFLHHLHSPVLSATQELPEIQEKVSIESLKMEAKWVIQGIEIDARVTYDKNTQAIQIDGIPTSSSGLSVTDLIKALSRSDLSVPSVISSLQLTNVVARSDQQSTIVILSTTAGSADVYLVFEKSASGSATAIAADIEEFKLADIIKQTTSIDVSGVPFIGSFVISTLAFSASTNTISHPLVSTIYDSGSPLQAYGGTLPKGLTAFFRAEIGGTQGIEVTYAQKMIDFKVPSNAVLSLQGLLSEIPSISSVAKALPSPLSDLLACNVVAIRFDPPSKTLSVTATFPQITIIPNILQVRNLDISLVVKLSSTNSDLRALDFNADWNLQGTNTRIGVSYDPATKKVLFAAVPKQGLNMRDLINSLTGRNLPIPLVIKSVTLTKIIGQKVADVFTFIFSGSIAGKAEVHLVYQTFGTVSHVAIAAGIDSFRFADLVRSAVNIDISGIPFFGTFSVPTMGLAISSGQLTESLLPQALDKTSPLANYGSNLPEGFTARFSTPIGSIKGVTGSYADKKLTFTVPQNVDASLGALLSAIPGVDVNSLALPPVFGDILKIQLKRFTFDVTKMEMSIEMFLKKITFYENALSMTNTQLKLVAKLSTPRSFSASAKSTVTLGGKDYAVDLRRDPSTKRYVISVETEKLPIFGIVTEIGATLLPDDLNQILGQVFNFNILNANIVYVFGAQPQQVLISGTPEILGLKTVHMTAVAIRYSGKVRLIQKYNFGTLNIADFIKKLLGVSLHKFRILNQNVNIEVVVSPSTMKGVSLTIPEFKGFNIDRGISIKAPLEWPSGCESDAFCAVAKKLLGNTKLSLQATIANARSFTMTATVGNLKLGGGVVLLHSGLQIVSGTNPSIGLVGSIEMKNPALTLAAAIRATIGGVKLEGSMSGCWNNAFGSSYLTICNLFLSMTIVPSPVPVSGLEVGGRIEVGKKSCGRVLTAEGYIGINVINPSENYFYADVGPVTFQKFFDTFCLSVKLPRPLAESGFPKGFKASFSLLGRELPHARISIPPGYRFKGTLNILGLEAFADIHIQLPYRISVKAALPPLRIANIFKMYASRRDRTRGPYLTADISTRRSPSIEASGFVEVLGISVQTKLRITTSKYELSITGRFLNLFNAALRITAKYGSFSKASYTVEGWFKSDLFDKIAKMVRNGLKRSANQADRHISSAQNKIRYQRAKFDRAIRDLRNARRRVNNARRSFDAAISKMERARRKVNRICRIRRCGSVCIGCPRGWKCCKKVWGKCICKRPKWNSCCKRITDPRCRLRNAACYALKKPLDFALRAAIRIVDKSKIALDVAKGALSVAKWITNGAKRSLNIAVAFLERVKRAYRTGVNALSALARFTLTKIINIRKMYFRAGLRLANGGRFQCRVEGVLMGRSINLSLSFNTRNIWSIARALAERAVSGLSKFIG